MTEGAAATRTLLRASSTGEMDHRAVRTKGAFRRCLNAPYAAQSVANYSTANVARSGLAVCTFLARCGSYNVRTTREADCVGQT